MKMKMKMTYSCRSSRFCTENALSSSILDFLLNTLLINSKLAIFSSPSVMCDALRLAPGISSFTPRPRAGFSFGNLDWNLPTDAVDAFAIVDATCNCNHSQYNNNYYHARRSREL